MKYVNKGFLHFSAPEKSLGSFNFFNFWIIYLLVYLMILMILKRTSTGGILKPKRKQCRDAADDSLGNDSSWTRIRDFRDSDKLNLEVWDCESASSRFYSSVVSLLSRSHGSCCLMLIKMIKIISYSSRNLPCVCEGFSGEIM